MKSFSVSVLTRSVAESNFAQRSRIKRPVLRCKPSLVPAFHPSSGPFFMNFNEEIPIRLVKFAIPEVVTEIHFVHSCNFFLTLSRERIESQIFVTNYLAPIRKSICVKVLRLRCKNDKVSSCFLLEN